MKIINSIDHPYLYVLNKNKRFTTKRFTTIKKNQTILLSSGTHIVISNAYLSLDLPEGTYELKIEQEKS